MVLRKLVLKERLSQTRKRFNSGLRHHGRSETGGQRLHSVGREASLVPTCNVRTSNCLVTMPANPHPPLEQICKLDDKRVDAPEPGLSAF
jgi:hypothetical protein